MNIRKIYLIKDIYCSELKWYNYDKIRITRYASGKQKRSDSYEDDYGYSKRQDATDVGHALTQNGFMFTKTITTEVSLKQAMLLS